MFVKYLDLQDKVFLLDYELTRRDNLGYNYFSYKVLNTLVVFRSSFELDRHQPVQATHVLETKDSIIVEVAPYDGNIQINDVLSVFAYKVPLEPDFELHEFTQRNVDTVYSIVDADQFNSKVGFVTLMPRDASGSLSFIVENHSVDIVLNH
jgi:hypothetical protein